MRFLILNGVVKPNYQSYIILSNLLIMANMISHNLCLHFKVN